jgi:RNA polymerase sigma-70 factor (ECF subfamily)
MDSDVHQLLLHGQRNRAFEKILDLYANKVFRLVLSLVGNAARAEDVSQDVFLKIWQALDVFDAKRAAVGTWVYRIARNTALTHLRAESYRQTLPIDSIDEPYVSPAESGEGDIRRVVEQLPEELREVVVLYYYQERSVDEVAAMLELPSGTVKSHLFRARRVLAETMKGGRR